MKLREKERLRQKRKAQLFLVCWEIGLHALWKTPSMQETDKQRAAVQTWRASCKLGRRREETQLRERSREVLQVRAPDRS